MIKHFNLTTAEADRLLTRYYDALTTDEEERQLRRFLTSPASRDSRYDEDRAVMGLLAVGRQLRFRHSRRWAWAGSVAAACIVVAGGLWAAGAYSSPDCVAYIRGERCTDSQVVMSEMKKTLHQVADNGNKPTIESQMSAVFGGNNMND